MTKLQCKLSSLGSLVICMILTSGKDEITVPLKCDKICGREYSKMVIRMGSSYQINVLGFSLNVGYLTIVNSSIYYCSTLGSVMLQWKVNDTM